MATAPLTDQATTYLIPADRFQLEVTDVRVHHVALQRWFNRRFLLREGVPCPVIFAGPMDAYAQFNRLWSTPKNPYSYLSMLKDFPGLEPAPLRFPLIAVARQPSTLLPHSKFGETRPDAPGPRQCSSSEISGGLDIFFPGRFLFGASRHTRFFHQTTESVLSRDVGRYASDFYSCRVPQLHGSFG